MILVLSFGWTQQLHTILVLWIAGCGMLYLLRIFDLINHRYASAGRKALTVGCIGGACVLWYSFRPLPEIPRVAVFPFQSDTPSPQSAGLGVAIAQKATDLFRVSLPEGARVVPFDLVAWEQALADTLDRNAVINASVRLGNRYAVYGTVSDANGQGRLLARMLDTSDTTEVVREIRLTEGSLSEAPIDLVAAIGQVYADLRAQDNSVDLRQYVPLDSAFALYSLGMGLAGLKTDDGYWEATEAFRSAMAVDSSFALPHYGMAQVQNSWRRQEPRYRDQNTAMSVRAIDQAKVSVILNPRLSEAYRLMAQIYMRDRRWDAMATVLKQAIAADPMEAVNYARLSLATPERFADLGYEDEAAICEQAVVLNREAVVFWQQLIDGYISAGRLKDALRFGRDILEKRPDKVEVLAAAGTAFRYNNRAFEAVEAYRQAVDLEPYNTDYYYFLSEAYAMRQNHEEIVKTFEEGIALMPENSELRYYMGVAHQKIGNWADAVPWFEKAIELDDHLNSHYYMARWFEKQGNRAMAVHHWEMRVNLGDPEEQWTKEATRRLGNLAPSSLPSLKNIGATL